MANSKKNVSTGKPRVAGSIYRAPAGTDLPTDASTALAADYVCLGYVSDDGLKNERSNDEETKAWGGDVVISTVTDEFTMTLIECMNIEVLKTVYGDSNVTGTSDTGITIKANDTPQESCIFVADLTMNGYLKRIVIPSGQVTEVGEITYSDGDPVGYETTITAHEDASSNTHYEYIEKAS